MILKILGIILIILCGSMSGFLYSGKLKQKAIILRKLSNMMQTLQIIMECNGGSIQNLLEILYNMDEYNKFNFLKQTQNLMSNKESFSAAWKKSIKSDNYLPIESIEILNVLGDKLGNSYLNSQKSILNQSQIQLESLYKTAGEEYKEKGRLYQKVGLLVGFAIAILLC